MRRSRILASGVAAATVLAVSVGTAATAATPTDTTKLRNAVTTDGVFKHLQSLQKVANRNGGTRASGTAGHTQSADYVASKLQAAGYQVTRQPFDFPFFEELTDPVFEQVSPNAKAYALATDFFTMEYSGSGDATGTVQPTTDVQIPPGAEASSSNSGCEAADFAGFTAGNVALIQRGTCTFAEKALNAQTAGATAVIIFNEGQPGRTDVINGTLGGPDFTIPVIGTTFAVGEELYNLDQAGDVVVHVKTDTRSEIRHTENVLADTPGGRADRTVVVGAHLDSVPEGPGINDNGSGSAADLEIALQMAKLGIKPYNKVRFAFWGAEESGLLGAEHYVANLSKAQLNDIMLNLNFDMVASPNYVRFVYDGDGSATPTAGPQGSARIEQVFLDYFGAQGQATDPTAFDGRSDYGPFIAAGIPAGGLFTGAEGEKTADQAAIYGGVAGAAYDPCYHQACDSLTPVQDGADADLYAELGSAYPMNGNINMKALGEMSDAIAHATLTFAMTTSSVNGTDRASDKVASTALEYKGGHVQK